MLKVIALADGFEIQAGGRTVLRHASAEPCLFIGRGEADVQMQRGNFAISDYVSERIPLRSATLSQDDDGLKVRFAASEAGPAELLMAIGEEGHLKFQGVSEAINRLWLRVPATKDEHVWGGGEQMSYFDMRGRHFPLWTSEPGVGRDKSTQLTWMADQAGAGGDYFHTNYPQPTFVSSRRYALHVETTAYSAFDFRHADFHEIEVWAVPDAIELFAGDTFVDLVGVLSDRFGRQPPLPDWVLNGAIVGLKQGAESFDRLQAYVA
ncbi:alpha-glucosidase, partial [Caulobacter sp. HMWF009]